MIFALLRAHPHRAFTKIDKLSDHGRPNSEAQRYRACSPRRCVGLLTCLLGVGVVLAVTQDVATMGGTHSLLRIGARCFFVLAPL